MVKGRPKGENGVNGNHRGDSLDAVRAYLEDEDGKEDEDDHGEKRPPLRPWDEKTFREPSLQEMNSKIGKFRL